MNGLNKRAHKHHILLLFAAIVTFFSYQITLSAHAETPPPLSVHAEKAPPAPFSKIHALLIGIDEYPGDAFQNLEGAKNDVAMIRDILLSRFQVPPGNIMVMTDKNATHLSIKQAFESLATKIKKSDALYIHYSGHGSFTHDLNGDEDKRWGKDSTWVSYGNREQQSANNGHGTAAAQPAMMPIRDHKTIESSSQLNSYDILDDEIHSWLAALGEKTDHVIFVSDSCHSGTITRGEDAMKTRGGPMDLRPHPLGLVPPDNRPLTGLKVSACRDSEKAREYRHEGATYGLFSWFWAKSLNEATPRETWGDIYKKTVARMRHEGGRQHPQIEGDQQRAVFIGAFPERRMTMAVKSISSDGKRASIQGGSLLGLTVGSIFKKVGSQGAEKNTASLEITRTKTTWSKGKVSGALKVGDLMTLEYLQPENEPVKVLVRADLQADTSLVDLVKKTIATLPAYALVDAQTKSDLVVRILRPKKGQSGEYIYESPAHSLPRSFPDQAAQAWLLTPAETLYQKKLMIGLNDPAQGVACLRVNLEKIVRAKNLINLTAAPGQKSSIALNITIWQAPIPGNTSEKITIDNTPWQKYRTVSVTEQQEYELKTGQLLTFSVKNTSSQGYYIYLINIMPDGKISPFYPTPYQHKEVGFLMPGEIRRIKAVAMAMDEPGREYIRVIASRKPIDIYLLSQKGFATRNKQGRLSPLEALLCAKAGLSRGENSGPISIAEWTTVQGTFSISNQDRGKK